ncbi:hypothetical protein JXB01_00830 [Candidatus Micrarchaeota archaeon]|nr:hypothetical protein [Candidatus Micrarchaeota archaeon]
MKKSYILCDASSIISLTNSCFIEVLYFLHNKFKVDFIIPPSVEYETVTRPLELQSNAFSLSALRIKKAIDDKVITVVDAKTEERTKTILSLANKIFFVRGQPLNIVHKGEMELIAVSKELNINNILVDERTTRLIIEAPFLFKSHLENEFRVAVMINRSNLERLKEISKELKIIRSTELLAVAYEHGFLDRYEKLKWKVLEAGLFNLKYSGCSIRSKEINDFMRAVKI